MAQIRAGTQALSVASHLKPNLDTRSASSQVECSVLASRNDELKEAQRSTRSSKHQKSSMKRLQLLDHTIPVLSSGSRHSWWSRERTYLSIST